MSDKMLSIGKIPEHILKRTVMGRLGAKRGEVLVHAGIGEDCAVMDMGGDVCVLSTDPITGALNDIGNLAFHITANDIASTGAKLVGIMVTIILPPDSTESDLRHIMDELTARAGECDVEIIGGHTEVSDVVIRPLISVTGVGKVKKDEIITTSGLRPDDELVVTKWIGLEGSAILAKDYRDKLLDKLPESIVDTAVGFADMISVIPESRVCTQYDISAMHDVTEGGIYGALWEMAEASGVGLCIDLKKIPIRQETIEICEVFNLDPYKLISSGSMLIGTPHGSLLTDKLCEVGINAAVIGYATSKSERIIRNGDNIRYLTPPSADEIYKV